MKQEPRIYSSINKNAKSLSEIATAAEALITLFPDIQLNLKAVPGPGYKGTPAVYCVSRNIKIIIIIIHSCPKLCLHA